MAELDRTVMVTKRTPVAGGSLRSKIGDHFMKSKAKPVQVDSIDYTDELMNTALHRVSKKGGLVSKSYGLFGKLYFACTCTVNTIPPAQKLRHKGSVIFFKSCNISNSITSMHISPVDAGRRTSACR